MSGPATPPPFPRDPGLQPERTALAWQRTLLGVLVGAVLLTAAAVRAEITVLAVAAAALAVAAVVPAVLRPPTGGAPQDGKLYSASFLRRVAALVVILGALGTASALVHILRSAG